MKKFLTSLFLFFCIGLSVSYAKDHHAAQEKLNVIFDTDLGNDIDDVLAFQMLLNYERQGLIDIAGVTISKSNPSAYKFADAFCRYNGKKDVPIGYAFNGTMPEAGNYLDQTLSSTFNGFPILPQWKELSGDVAPGHILIRKLLAQSEDNSITIIAVGPLTNIARLLDSEGDEYSPLNGVELVKAKVKSISLMSGNFKKSTPEWNLKTDFEASKTVYEKCPVDMIISGSEVGTAIRYPAKSILNDFGNPESIPLCIAYMSYMKMPYNRECWDLTSVLDAIDPDNGAIIRSVKGHVAISEKGTTSFIPDNNGNRQYLIVKNPDKAAELLVKATTSCTKTGYGLTLSSPDGKNVLTINRDRKEGLTYSLACDGKKVLMTRAIEMIANDEHWDGRQPVRAIIHNTVNEDVKFSVSRRFNKMSNHYNSLTLDFGDYLLEFRAYSDGVAYRFIGNKPGRAFFNEKGGYELSGDYMCLAPVTDSLQNWYEENYIYRRLSKMPQDSLAILPPMVDAGNVKLLFADANLYHYSGTYLRPNGQGFDLVWANYPKTTARFRWGNKLYATSRYNYIVEGEMQRTFPWKVVGTFRDSKEMLTSELIYMLSDKTTDDFSWVKPGKVLWDWWNAINIYGVDFEAGINTATYKYLIDYASKHNFEYILIDEGWSAKESLLEVNPDTDIQEICDYGKKKGVGVCLWAKWINVNNQLDEAFDLMEKWGVAGVKIDFMDRNDAEVVDFYERVAQKAAEKHFLVDMHAAYPNEGMRAKYPNMITREGVLGLEYNKMKSTKSCTPRHQLIIPFLRQWVGPMDFTPGSMMNAQPQMFRTVHNEPWSQGTRCHQMAMFVLYESPMQMVSDSPTKYDQNPEWFEYLEKVPTVWDETIPIVGRIGETLIMARKSGRTYYLAGMSAGKSKDVTVALDFLQKGKWHMTLYTDGINSGRNAKDYVKTKMKVSATDSLNVRFGRNGGFIAVFEK